jgi:hypothetical protein
VQPHTNSALRAHAWHTQPQPAARVASLWHRADAGVCGRAWRRQRHCGHDRTQPESTHLSPGNVRAPPQRRAWTPAARYPIQGRRARAGVGPTAAGRDT